MLLATSNSGFADDGGIAFGGSPRLLTRHPSVTMVSEIVRIDVGDELARVDCRFVFRNDGPACTVRMGFPDQGEGAYDPDEEHGDSDVMKTPARTTFSSFRSWVDGRAVKSRLIRADKPGRYWHTKTVHFPAHATHLVRDLYTQRIGGGVAVIGAKTGNNDEVGYILHTGSSWHGPIGRAEIDFSFHGKRVPGVVKALPLRQVSPQLNESEVKSASVLAPNVVVWKGPCAPLVSRRELMFVRTNFRPTEDDDLTIAYGYRLAP